MIINNDTYFIICDYKHNQIAHIKNGILELDIAEDGSCGSVIEIPNNEISYRLGLDNVGYSENASQEN